MSTVTHTATIEVSRAAAWAVLDDFGGVHRWHFNVEASPVTSARHEGLGATRRIRMYDGTEVTERIVGYEPDHSMKVSFVEHAMPMHHADVTFRLASIADARTEVTVHMDYSMKYGPFGWVVDKAFLQPTMRKVFRRMVEGLEHHIVTGELVGSDD